MHWIAVVCIAFLFSEEPSASEVRIVSGNFSLRYAQATPPPSGSSEDEDALFRIRARIVTGMAGLDPAAKITLRPRLYAAVLDSEVRLGAVEFDATVEKDGKAVLQSHYCGAEAFAYYEQPLRFQIYFEALGEAVFQSLTDFSHDAASALAGRPRDTLRKASCPERFVPDSNLVEVRGRTVGPPSPEVLAAWWKIRHAPRDFAALAKDSSIDTARIAKICRFWYRQACQGQVEPGRIVFLFPCGLERVPVWKTEIVGANLTCYWRLIYDTKSGHFIQFDESMPQKPAPDKATKSSR
jgi:hypothetical protein